MVLIKAGLDKQAFVGTGVVSAVIIDPVRLLIYGLSFSTQQFVHLSGEIMGVIAVATGSAFLGAWVGTRVLKQITLRAVRIGVATMLMLVGTALLTGLL